MIVLCGAVAHRSEGTRPCRLWCDARWSHINSRRKTLKARGAKDERAAGSMFGELLRQVRRVPRGKVATYGDIAYAAGYPGAARQVAWALHAESAGLPWHRIVGAGGTILLTGEHGFEQRMRLQSEGVGFLGLKVNMATHRHSFFAVAVAMGERKSAKHAGARGPERKISAQSGGRKRS
jgi:methylated-DNA-protein-cysteine methyltransferase related protein